MVHAEFFATLLLVVFINIQLLLEGSMGMVWIAGLWVPYNTSMLFWLQYLQVVINWVL